MSFRKESLIIGVFGGKWPIKMRYPVGLRHPVHRRRQLLYRKSIIVFLGKYMDWPHRRWDRILKHPSIYKELSFSSFLFLWIPGNWTDPTVVGSNYKTPTSPIWVLHGGNHYTVLIARSKGLLKLVQCVAVCCSVLQCVAVCCTSLYRDDRAE